MRENSKENQDSTQITEFQKSRGKKGNGKNEYITNSIENTKRGQKSQLMLLNCSPV